MDNLRLHGKTLQTPSFFQIYNYGGGFGHKTREMVYADLTGDTPALFNYYYISNKFPHMFESSEFDNLGKYADIGEALTAIRDRLARENIYSGCKYSPFDFGSKVIFLDSGAANIVNYLAEKNGYDEQAFNEELCSAMRDYYDFADRYKFDVVAGFDLGGKYTFKGGELKNAPLNCFLNRLDVDATNKMLFDKTLDYLKEKREYYPAVLAVVHGRTPADYADYARYIVREEEEKGYRFKGFALGGVASWKALDASWFEGGFDDRLSKRTAAPARAATAVRKVAGDRPIHVLGGGGYENIALNYFCGATSFDVATPSRRVGDGNGLSADFMFSKEPLPREAKFGKAFVGGYNSDCSLRREEAGYVAIDRIPDDFELCGCAACKRVNSFYDIKKLYSEKSNDDEAFYYACQLMNAHAVLQHRKLCELLSGYDDMDTFRKENPTALNIALNRIYNKIREKDGE